MRANRNAKRNEDRRLAVCQCACVSQREGSGVKKHDSTAGTEEKKKRERGGGGMQVKPSQALTGQTRGRLPFPFNMQTVCSMARAQSTRVLDKSKGPRSGWVGQANTQHLKDGRSEDETNNSIIPPTKSEIMAHVALVMKKKCNSCHLYIRLDFLF